MKIGGTGGSGGDNWWEMLVRKVRPVTPAKPTEPVKQEAPVYSSSPFEDYSLEGLSADQARSLLETHAMAFTHPPFEKYGLKSLREALGQVVSGEAEGKRMPILEHAGIAINSAIAKTNETTALGSYPDSYAMRLFYDLNTDAKAVSLTLAQSNERRPGE